MAVLEVKMTLEQNMFSVNQPNSPPIFEATSPVAKTIQEFPVAPISDKQSIGLETWQQVPFLYILRRFDPESYDKLVTALKDGELELSTIIKPQGDWLSLLEYFLKDVKDSDFWQDLKHDLTLMKAWFVIDELVDDYFRTLGWRVNCLAALPLIMSYLAKQPPELMADLVLKTIEALTPAEREKQCLVRLSSPQLKPNKLMSSNILTLLMPAELLPI